MDEDVKMVSIVSEYIRMKTSFPCLVNTHTYPRFTKAL